MKKRLIALCFLASLLLTLASPAAAAEAPRLNAAAAFLYERNSGQILAEQDADKTVYPASMTKVMTCLLALEHLTLSDTVTVSETALAGLDEAGSSVDLLPGEQLTVEQLLYCMMLSSANEACNVAAEAVCGGVDSFVEMMNQRAAELGCTGTHFANTHGLHNEDHYTTARDLATITLAALENYEFRKIVSTPEYTVPETNLSGPRRLTTTNRLIDDRQNNPYYDSRVTGVKTGFTTPAGRCLIATAEEGELSLLSVVCGCDTTILETGDLQFESFPETEKLLDYGFTSFTFATVLTTLYPVAEVPVSRSAGADFVSLAPGEEVSALLPIDYDKEAVTLEPSLMSGISAPVAAGDELGSVTVVYHGKELGTVPLVAVADVERANLLTYFSPARNGTQGWLRTALLILILAVLVWLIVSLFTRSARRRRRRKQRRPGGGQVSDPDWFRKG